MLRKLICSSLSVSLNPYGQKRVVPVSKNSQRTETRMKLLNDRSAVCQRILPLLALSTLGVFPPAVQAQTPEVSQAVQHAVSVPVRDLPNVREPRALHVIPVRPLPVGPTTGAPDTALQTSE